MARHGADHLKDQFKHFSFPPIPTGILGSLPNTQADPVNLLRPDGGNQALSDPSQPLVFITASISVITGRRQN